MRQERSSLQHSEGEPRFDREWNLGLEREMERFEAGREESTMSVKREGNVLSPICGVVAVVAPSGVHRVKPVLQSPLAVREETEDANAFVAKT